MLKILLLISLFSYSSFAQKKDFSSAEATLMRNEALKLWEARDDQHSLEGALSKFEMAHETFPEDLEILEFLARGYFVLGELHQTIEESKKKSFEKSRAYGEKGLMLNPEYKKYASGDLEKAIDKLTEKEVPLLFWSAASLGKWAKLNGIMSSLKYKGQILASIKRVEKLKPDFFYGAVPRYWGGFYAVAPSIAGGDMDKSKKNFKKAMEMAPEYLGTKTLYAELYLVKEEDKKEFKKQLEEVIAAPKGPAAIAPENMLEKRKAEMLLNKIEKLFD